MKRLALALALAALAHPACAGWTPGLDAAFGGAAEVSGRSDGGGELYRARARPTLKWSGEAVAFEAAWDVASAWSKTPEAALGETPTLRICDLERVLSSGPENMTVQNLDRLNFEYREGDYSAKLGRQPLGHGSGRFFNPSDIFAPKNPGATWSEYKGGVDAARLTARIGELSEVEAFAVAHEEGWRDSYLLLRGRATTEAGDVSAYAGRTLGAPTVGADFAFDLSGAGCYVEGAARLDGEPRKTARLVAGAHTRLADDLDGLFELYFNGPGESDRGGYFRTIGTREWRNGEIFTLGRHYAVAGLEYGFSPVASLGANALINLDDGSALFLPTATWSATEYVTASAGASMGTGGDRTEFGPAPDVIYLELKANL